MKNTRQTILIVLTIIATILAMIVIIDIAVNDAKKENTINSNATHVPFITNTPIYETYPPTGVPTATPEFTPTPAVTATPTPTATATPSPTATPPVATSTPGIIITPKPDEEYSFLEGISRDFFEDAAEGANGSWYPGAVVKNEDGTISYPWDRFPSTLNTLAKYNAVYRKNTDQNVAYITFDLGYEFGCTSEILDVLKEKNVKALFFITGDYINNSANHELIKRMVNEGHLVGNHTNTHPNMALQSDKNFADQLIAVDNKFYALTGQHMSYYRPPEGAATERCLCLAKHLGYTTVFWSFAYGDYDTDNQPDPAVALQKCKDWLHPGVVYLLHGVSTTNTAILGDLIDYIQSEGYEIRNMDK